MDIDGELLIWSVDLWIKNVRAPYADYSGESLLTPPSDAVASIRCPYDILGVSWTANTKQIKTAYRKLAIKWYSDKI